MSQYKAAALIAVIGLPASLGISYLLMLAEEPRAVWLWCKVLRACT